MPVPGSATRSRAPAISPRPRRSSGGGSRSRRALERRVPVREGWRPAGDGDAGGCGDREGAVGVHVMDEAGCLVLGAVVSGAVAGEVGRVGGAERVRDVVVELAALGDA